MAKNTSVLLGDSFEAYINKKISSGLYSSASEVIRTALCYMQEEEKKTEQLQKALIAGEKSGKAIGFNRKDFLKKMNQKYI
jgi:antitoxin ParD1/3/4